MGKDRWTRFPQGQGVERNQLLQSQVTWGGHNGERGSPTSGQCLAGQGAGGVRALGSPRGAEEEESVSHLWPPVLPTSLSLTERLPYPSEGLWPRPGNGG